MDISSPEALVATLRAREPVIRAEGVKSLALFGSRARGDHRIDSDVDVVIDVDGNRRFSFLDLIGIAHCIEDATGLHANVFTRRSLSDEFRREVERDAIEVFE